MADDTTTAPAPPAATPAPKEKEQRYTREELKERARDFFDGISEHIVVGALHADRRKTFTVDEAQAIIDDCMAKEHES